MHGCLTCRLAGQPCPFTLKLIYSFYDKDFFYLVIPIATGGDLSFHLKQAKPPGFERSRCRTYIAQLARVLQINLPHSDIMYFGAFHQ